MSTDVKVSQKHLHCALFLNEMTEAPFIYVLKRPQIFSIGGKIFILGAGILCLISFKILFDFG